MNYSFVFRNWSLSARENRFVFIILYAHKINSLSIWLVESRVTLSSRSWPMFGSSSIRRIWMMSKKLLKIVMILYARILTFLCVSWPFKKISQTIILINFSQSGTAPEYMSFWTYLSPSICFYISLFVNGWFSFCSSVKWLRLSWEIISLYYSIF